MDKDLVMPGTDTVTLPWRIVREQTGRRPDHSGKIHPVIENGGREYRSAVKFHKSLHELGNPEVGGDFQYLNESNVCRAGLENNNSCTMSSTHRGEVYNDSHTDYEQSTLNTIVNKETVFQRDEPQRECLKPLNNLKKRENDINADIRDSNTNKLTALHIFRKNSNPTPDNISLPHCQRKSNLHHNNLLFYLVKFVTGYNITCLRVLLFIFFIGNAFLQNVLPGDSRYPSSWPFPGADAKAVISLSKNVLMTDADHKHVSWIGEIDPSSDSTQEESSFNDFPDVTSDRDPASDSINKSPGYKRSAGDGSNPGKDRDNDELESKDKVSLEDEEYEAYDDSPGEKVTADETDSNSKKQKSRTETVDENSDNQDQYSDEDDEGDEIIGDEQEDEDYEEDEEDEDDGDWGGGVRSQPIFVPPGMNVNSDAAGMETAVKDSTDGDTTAKSDDMPPNREIPEYMLKLYQKFTQKHYIHPASDTVRSFSNINDDILFNISNGNELPGAKTRNHTLVFNISSFPRGEQINLAQLRLYKLVERDRNTYVGDDRKVSLYEVISQDDGTRHLKLVSQKHIYGRNSGWESFDVTPAVRRWVAEIENGAVQVLEVTIESIFNSMWGSDVDISIEPRNKKEPLLVVFSKQINKRLVHQQERDELLQHDITLSDIEDVDNYTAADLPSSSPASSSPSSSSSSSRSSAMSRSDQTAGDEQEDDGSDDEEDFSKEDSYGSIDEMTSYAKVTQSMRTGKVYLSRSKKKIRVKRSKSSSKRNVCRRTKLEVDFRDIQGHAWIVAPKKYQAFECSGKCYFPLGDYLRPTKHAIIRANLHLHNKKVTRPCCVPTKLDPISLLYLDSKTNGYTFKYEFEGMKVVECGCR